MNLEFDVLNLSHMISIACHERLKWLMKRFPGRCAELQSIPHRGGVFALGAYGWVDYECANTGGGA